MGKLATMAVKAAARVRADLGIGPAEGLCPFDVADGLGVPVRLIALPSLEGMYSPKPKPTIVVSAERPVGRRRYTCSHEIGHHVFGHGTRLHQLGDESPGTRNPVEFMAQRFAAALLMPKLAVESAFARRGWHIEHATAEMIFTVAQELGVGFTTLIFHLERTLRSLPKASAEALSRERLPKLRDRLASIVIEHDLVVVDQHWGRRTIDVEVGDVVILPKDALVVGACVSLIEKPVRHYVASAAGTGRVRIGAGSSEVALRVSRRAFTGLSRFRHLEEIADDD